MLPFKIISFELLLLLISLALMVYIQKQQVKKIYSYLAAAIFILVLVLIVCTSVVSICKPFHKLEGVPSLHGKPHIKKQIILHDEAFLEDEFARYENEMHCDKPCCASHKDGEPEIIRKEIIRKECDSLPQKRIIIRKK